MTPTTPAPVSSGDLPPLPEPAIASYQTDSVMRVLEVRSFSTDQMRAFALAALRAAAVPVPAAAPVAPIGYIESRHLQWMTANRAGAWRIQTWISKDAMEHDEPVPVYAGAPPVVQELSEARLSALARAILSEHYTDDPEQSDLMAMAWSVLGFEGGAGGAYLCISPACGPECSDCNCSIPPGDVLLYATRYAYLRGRPLDAVEAGGVFAGKTPDNVVLNGADLDEAIENARAVLKAATSPKD